MSPIVRCRKPSAVKSCSRSSSSATWRGVHRSRGGRTDMGQSPGMGGYPANDCRFYNGARGAPVSRGLDWYYIRDDNITISTSCADEGTMTMTARAVPVPTPVTQPYWDSLDRHELTVQRCLDCRSHVFYPRPSCPSC